MMSFDDAQKEKVLKDIEDKTKKLSFLGAVKADNFPSSPNVYHFNPIAFVEQMKRMIGKHPIDLRTATNWQTQFDPVFGTRKQQDVACYKACHHILTTHFGMHAATAPNAGQFFVAHENKLASDTTIQDNYLVENPEEFSKGINYIDEQLESGYPVLVGVDHTFKIKDLNSDKSTDHFIVIMGRGSDLVGDFYCFYEVGTYKENEDKYGRSDKNKLHIKESSTLRGEAPNDSSKKYVVTQIRKNILK